jgi:protein-tyrosine-phosphatase
MAAGLLARRLRERGAEARVRSAGTLAWKGAATDHAVAALGERGVEIADHQSRQLTPDIVAEADLVLGMTRDHVWAVVARHPDALTRTFLVGEAVRLGTATGARRPDQPLAEWAAMLGALRPAEAPPGHASDEIADPAGEPLDVYRRTAARLDRLTAELAALLQP